MTDKSRDIKDTIPFPYILSAIPDILKSEMDLKNVKTKKKKKKKNLFEWN